MNYRNVMMARSKATLATGAVAASLLAGPVAAYPIDCAILLCLAGGFPASAECSAAKAEFMRRITPWPVEPPLQLWRCPMGGGGMSLPGGGGSDSIPPEVAQYRDAIELWQLSKHVTNGSGGRDVYTSTVRYGYAPSSGEWVRFPTRDNDLPEWLDGTIRQRTGKGFLDEYGRGFRSIVVRMQDHTGAYMTEWVSY